MSNLRYIKVKNKCWIQFKHELINIGFDGIPKNVHLSLSFKDDLKDINFHVTNNTKDDKNKPQIKICLIDRELINAMGESLAVYFIRRLFDPVDIGKFQQKNDKTLYFIPYEQLTNSANTREIENKFAERLDEFSKYNENKTRIEIRGDIENILSGVFQDTTTLAYLTDQIVEFTDEISANAESGLLIAGNEGLFIGKIHGQWFRQRDNIDKLKLLREFIGENIARRIIWRTMRAIINVRDANTYEEVKHLNKPLRISKRK